jgi:hypothetical protein
MLFRRELLVRPDIDLSPDDLDPTFKGRRALNINEVLDFVDDYDISVRWVDMFVGDPNSGNRGKDGVRDTLLPNSLGDLTQRENRFLHVNADGNFNDAAEINGFPFPFWPLLEGTPANTNSSFAGAGATAFVSRRRFARFPHGIPILALTRGQTEVQLQNYSPLMASASLSDNILAFDVRFYDPGAPLFAHSDPPNVVLAPGDSAYPFDVTGIRTQLNAGVLSGVGAYVDLNYARTRNAVGIDLDRDGNTEVTSVFAVVSNVYSGLDQVDDGLRRGTYDVWSTQYERDGVDQNRNGFIDEGTNEVDDDEENGVDDIGERETAPPYDVPLRGIKVTIRKMDYETRQTRQVSVVGDFVPE